MRAILQHYLNSNHVFCRLRDLGIPTGKAVKIARIYENLIHRFLYGG